MDRQQIRRVFSVRPVLKKPVSVEDLGRARTELTQMRRIRRVEQTFDLRWTGRYSFGFTESENEAVIRTLPPKERGGIIVFPSDAEVRVDILSFILAWLTALHNRFKLNRRMVKADEGLTGTGYPFGVSLGRRFSGRYRGATGVWFDKESATLELVFIQKRDLLRFAAALAQELEESILLKTEATGELFLVNTSDIGTEL